jgi:hypothetical protein
MQLSNVHIRGVGIELEPTFKEFINKLALAKPEWVFTHDSVQDEHYAVSRSMEKGLQPQDGYKFATRMHVEQNNRFLGSLRIERNVSQNFGKRWCLVVSSENIRNSRRGTSTKTTNMLVALRNAKTYLVCPSLSKVVHEAVSQAWGGYISALSRLRQPIARGHYVKDWGKAQILLNAFVRGQQPDAAILSAFSDEMHTARFEEALAQFMLAEHMETLPQGMIAMHLMDGCYAFFLGGEALKPLEEVEKTEPQLVPFEALPEDWQNKLAVLQLLTNGEVVKDVGFRLAADSFVIAR